MVLLFIPIFSICFLNVLGSPQLKLDPSGYESISINDHNTEYSIPLSSKLTLENGSKYSGISASNLEKVADPINEDNRFSAALQQHKRHYNSHNYSPEKKSIPESQSNMIGIINKKSSNRKPNFYLTLGIPTTLTHPTKKSKETQTVIPIFEKNHKNSESKSSYDDSDSSEEFGTPQKVNKKSVQVKIGEKKSKPVSKFSKTIGSISEKIGNEQSEIVSSATIESDFESVNSKDADNVTNLMTDFQRVWDLIDAQSDLKKKYDKIESDTSKSGFTMVTHFPSLHIHHKKNSLASHKSSTIFSPIYSSSLDIVDGNSHEKTRDSIKEQEGNNFWSDDKNSKSSRGFGHFYQGKNLQRFPSILVLKNINLDHSNPKIGSNIPFPILGTNYNVQSFSNQQPIQPMKKIITNMEMNSIPVATNHFDHSLPAPDSAIFNPPSRWEKIMSRRPIDLGKKGQNNNDSDLEYVDSINEIPNLEVKADSLKNYIGKMSFFNERNSRHVERSNQLLPPNVESTKRNLVIGIAHEIAPDDLEKTIIDVKKEDANGNHEMRDVPHLNSSASLKSNCKHMKPSTPTFYQFLTKFSNTVLSKALEYELHAQAQDTVSKLIEATTNKNLDDILEFLA